MAYWKSVAVQCSGSSIALNPLVNQYLKTIFAYRHSMGRARCNVMVAENKSGSYRSENTLVLCRLRLSGMTCRRLPNIAVFVGKVWSIHVHAHC